MLVCDRIVELPTGKWIVRIFVGESNEEEPRFAFALDGEFNSRDKAKKASWEFLRQLNERVDGKTLYMERED
jgi:hypothetical protein